MDSDRPPLRTGDLFICFTARHHSSSMKMSSKSILSPGRRDPPISLTTSLSRRLRTNRSIKGGASPAMFPTTGKKRTGAGFENPEPSSPKVTCIGQVRVKSRKKQGKRLRSLSRRHSTGDVSFRKKLQHSGDGFSKSTNLGSKYSNQEMLPEQRNNQRWVHLPLTICEALRAFGSEFSCLFPCRSSCFSPAKEEKTATGPGPGSGREEGSSSCARVFTRWLVAFQDGDDGCRGSRRDIELVVGDENDEDEEDTHLRVSRRHVFDDLEIVDNRIEGSRDEARMSICIPPKNALLLMRCRSDPLKMEALANRLWDSTINQNDEEDEALVDNEDEIMQTFDLNESEANYEEYEANQETNLEQSVEAKDDVEEQIPEINNDDEEESTIFGSLFEEIAYEENDEMVDAKELFETEDEIYEIPVKTETEESNIDKVKVFEGKNEEEMETQFAERSETMEETAEESKEREDEELEREMLPECLLLMMCEPKLSMEVSKETWVSSKDFFRRHSSRKKPPPPPPVKPTDGQDASKVSIAATVTLAKHDKHVTFAASTAAAVQPRRSSCSLPAPPSMAEMLEQKLVNAVGYEPCVLTRCKSEPMRTAAAKLAPADSYFWKNRKLEPLRRASFGVGGAAGLGF